ncbi:MAG: glycoside hydrolase family 18 protein [Rikenellaceae bacterium]
MKKLLLSVLVASALLSGCKGVSEAPQASNNDFIHSTYIAKSRIKSQEMIQTIDFDSFEYLYIMAYPNFKDMDFSLPLDVIIDSMVTKFEYPKDKSGVELVALFVKEAQKSGTKVLLSFAHDGFLPIVENKETQDKFAEMMVQFMSKYGYDGIEIDWEHTVTLPLHADLMRNIRMRLDERYPNEHKLLASALHSWQKYSPELAAEVSKDVDWFNLMCYDIGGGNWGSIPSHNTPMDVIMKDVEYWASVFDKDKISVGLANYGFIYRGLSPGENSQEKGGLKKCGSYISYNKALELIDSGWEANYDSVAQVNYFFSPDKTDFIAIENHETINNKLKWFDENGFKRIFWWEYEYDIILPTQTGERVSHHLIDLVTDYKK